MFYFMVMISPILGPEATDNGLEISNFGGRVHAITLGYSAFGLSE